MCCLARVCIAEADPKVVQLDHHTARAFAVAKVIEALYWHGLIVTKPHPPDQPETTSGADRVQNINHHFTWNPHKQSDRTLPGTLTDKQARLNERPCSHRGLLQDVTHPSMHDVCNPTDCQEVGVTQKNRKMAITPPPQHA